MDAVKAFEHQKDLLLEQLNAAEDLPAASRALAFALEAAACELAQDEQDDMARQRQQAVIALARRAPALIEGVTAKATLVERKVQQTDEPKAVRVRKGCLYAGALLLAGLAIYEIIAGHPAFAVMQVLGAGLAAAGLRVTDAPQTRMEARARLMPDVRLLMAQTEELMRAADVCIGDIALTQKNVGRAEQTADDATLDLLSELLQAKISGNNAMAMRSLAKAEQFARALGLEIVQYDAEHAPLFDLLPTLSGERTVRPAILKDGRLLRRGLAARAEERGAAL